MASPTTTNPLLTRPRRSARERLLEAADELFYAEGIHSVGIDRVIEHAGVAKASLYSAFGSKEELVRAYLERRRDTREARIATEMAKHEDARGKLLSVFDALAVAAAVPGFRGCAFQNASGDLAVGPSVGEVRAELRGWTTTLFRDLATEAGARDPELLARQLVMLYDGATTSAHADHDQGAPMLAKAAAATLLDAATG